MYRCITMRLIEQGMSSNLKDLTHTNNSSSLNIIKEKSSEMSHM
jgi:hypothetical protein